jgi:septal ring-binding cell division protein DamX
MSVEVSRSNGDSFQAYLDRLTGQGLDISQLLIFEAQLNGRAFYSMMYGDYKDRQEAKSRIDQLPDILRAEKPIPRSAGSILKGITVPVDN